MYDVRLYGTVGQRDPPGLRRQGHQRSSRVAPVSSTASYAPRYNQNEELFIELTESFTVPSFPIHHDVRQSVPTQRISLHSALGSKASSL